MSDIPSLSRFTAELHNRNIAKPSHFYVEIAPPSDKIDELISMWCNSATTPMNMMYTKDDFIENGVKRKFVYDQDYQNLVLNFYMDQNYEIKYFFDMWTRKIVPSKRYINYYDDYVARSLTLFMLNQAENVVYEYEYRNVYPKTIQSMDLNYSNGSQAAQFSVEFAYETVYFTQYTPRLAGTDNLDNIDMNIEDLSLTGIDNMELLNQTIPSISMAEDIGGDGTLSIGDAISQIKSTYKDGLNWIKNAQKKVNDTKKNLRDVRYSVAKEINAVKQGVSTVKNFPADIKRDTNQEINNWKNVLKVKI